MTIPGRLPWLGRSVDRLRPGSSEPAASFARDFEVPPRVGEGQSVTRELYKRLDPNDVAEVQRRMAEDPDAPRAPLDEVDLATRRTLVLCWGMWLQVESIGQKTGLPAVQPPTDVHAMARGPLAAAGGLYEADLVVDSLRSSGVGIDDVRTALDFGCSSGRVLRVLAAAYPMRRWIGCDPNERAIVWVKENLSGVEAFVSVQEPPLPLPDGALDLAFAISIWSHFQPSLGLRWFDEMHRVIRSGGHLVCTTHGLAAIACDASNKLRPPAQLDEIADAIYRRGWWYAAEFGERGDWGIVNPSWGTAFLSPEWMLSQLCPRWRVLEFAAGRNQASQDVYVLERA